MRIASLLAIAGAALPASPVVAQDEAFELWLNPSIGTTLDADTTIELETGQRFRSENDGRVDTYFARLWLTQDVTANASVASAVEYRVNDGGANELRIIQQLSTSHGILKTRLRFEQRLIDDTDRIGLRLRPRIGVGFPLDEHGSWSATANAEMFWTVRGSDLDSDTGIIGMRTTAGFAYAATANVSLGISYLRQQTFEDNGPDSVGHAPLVGIEYIF